MVYAFKNLLIPIDFTINSEVAIHKALELVDRENGMLHLLHVACRKKLTISSFQNGDNKDPVSKSGGLSEEERLHHWKIQIEGSRPDLKVYHWISYDTSVTRAIEQKAIQLGIDLIVISKNTPHEWFPFLNTVRPSKIASQTGTTVLTVKPGSLRYPIKTVVVPVNSHAPFDKMKAIAALHKKFRIKVHLVTFLNEGKKADDFSSSALVQFFRWIKENLSCPVEYSVIHGTNKAKALLHYAERTGADLMLVEPRSETKTGWLDQQIPDVIPAESKIQLLMLSPECKNS